MPPGCGNADGRQHSSGGARGAAQIRGIKTGDGRLDARRQGPRVVIEHLRKAVPWVHRADCRSPQLPYVVARQIQPAVRLPERSPTQVLVEVSQRAPGKKRPLPDLVASDREGGSGLARRLALS